MIKKSVIDLIFQLKFSCLSKEEKIREELNLSPAEFRGLLTITPGGEIPCNIFSKKMGLSISRGSRVIDKLLNSGYLKEIEDSGDKRVMKVTLTQKGLKTQRKIYKNLEECEQVILKKMSGQELNALEKSLIKISEILVSS